MCEVQYGVLHVGFTAQVYLTPCPVILQFPGTDCSASGGIGDVTADQNRFRKRQISMSLAHLLSRGFVILPSREVNSGSSIGVRGGRTKRLPERPLLNNRPSFFDFGVLFEAPSGNFYGISTVQVDLCQYHLWSQGLRREAESVLSVFLSK